jgi:hypothetical protein
MSRALPARFVDEFPGWEGLAVEIAKALVLWRLFQVF